MAAIKGYLALAVILLLLAGGTGLYFKGRIDKGYAAQLASLQQDITKLTAQRDAERAARTMDALQAKLDADAMATLVGNITELNEYANGLKDRDAVCLSGPDTDRLRSLWGDH